MAFAMAADDYSTPFARRPRTSSLPRPATAQHQPYIPESAAAEHIIAKQRSFNYQDRRPRTAGGSGSENAVLSHSRLQSDPLRSNATTPFPSLYPPPAQTAPPSKPYDIGVAVGSPSQPPSHFVWQQELEHHSPIRPNDSWPLPPSRNRAPSVSTTVRMKKSWQALGGLWARRQPGISKELPALPDPQNQSQPPNQIPTTRRRRQTSGQSKDKARKKTPSPPPTIKDSQSVPSAGDIQITVTDEHNNTTSNPDLLPRLDIAIPNEGFDRYSVMFAGVLTGNASPAASSTSLSLSPSSIENDKANLFERRQPGSLENLTIAPPALAKDMSSTNPSITTLATNASNAISQPELSPAFKRVSMSLFPYIFDYLSPPTTPGLRTPIVHRNSSSLDGLNAEVLASILSTKLNALSAPQSSPETQSIIEDVAPKHPSRPAPPPPPSLPPASRVVPARPAPVATQAVYSYTPIPTRVTKPKAAAKFEAKVAAKAEAKVEVETKVAANVETKAEAKVPGKHDAESFTKSELRDTPHPGVLNVQRAISPAAVYELPAAPSPAMPPPTMTPPAMPLPTMTPPIMSPGGMYELPDTPRSMASVTSSASHATTLVFEVYPYTEPDEDTSTTTVPAALTAPTASAATAIGLGVVNEANGHAARDSTRFSVLAPPPLFHETHSKSSLQPRGTRSAAYAHRVAYAHTHAHVPFHGLPSPTSSLPGSSSPTQSKSQSQSPAPSLKPSSLSSTAASPVSPVPPSPMMLETACEVSMARARKSWIREMRMRGGPGTVREVYGGQGRGVRVLRV